MILDTTGTDIVIDRKSRCEEKIKEGKNMGSQTPLTFLDILENTHTHKTSGQ